MSDHEPENPNIPADDGNVLQFNGTPNKNFIERIHFLSQIQLETLDNEIDSYLLYKMKDDPVDIAKFLVVFNEDKGIDLAFMAKATNFHLEVPKLLALLHNNSASLKNLDEIIDPSIKLILDSS